MAAARHVLIMCGPTEIDGHAFCAGVDSLYFLDHALKRVASRVTLLIGGSLFRPRYMPRKQGRLPLDIGPLGELLDMYHTHKATKRHDKVFALLGMCSDDLSTARMEPDYTIPWKVLMCRLVKHLLGDGALVDTWEGREAAVIKSKGFVIGAVGNLDVDKRSGENRAANISLASLLPTQLGYRIGEDVRWPLKASARPVQVGDLMCLLQGASRPTIIRARKDYFDVVAIAAESPQRIRTRDGALDWSTLVQPASFNRDLFLAWDWESPFIEHDYDRGIYSVLMSMRDEHWQRGKSELEIDLHSAFRMWNTAEVLSDVASPRAVARRKSAGDLFQKVVGDPHTHSPECQCYQVPFSWAAESGNTEVVSMLLEKNDIHVEDRDTHGYTPLALAAMNGHAAVVKLLIETGRVDVDSKDSYGDWSPLSLAARAGHAEVVELLLATGEVDTHMKKNYFGWTAISIAANYGHAAVVKLLLEKGKVEADSRGHNGRTSLSLAAEAGHTAIVKLLLETDQVNVEFKNGYPAQTPLSLAAQYGREAVVKLLLETGEVDVDSKDPTGQTPLQLALENGHEAVARLLQSFKAG